MRTTKEKINFHRKFIRIYERTMIMARNNKEYDYLEGCSNKRKKVVERLKKKL